MSIDLQTAVQHHKTEAYAVDTSKGGFDGRVSSQWFSRPDDQRFTSLNDLYAYTKASADNSFDEIVNVKDVEVRAKSDDPDDMRLIVPRSNGGTFESKPNNWSFGQLCGLVKAPAGYLRRLPGQVAGINLQYGLSSYREGPAKVYATENGGTELRAATGPAYGRIYDYEVVSAVQNIAGNGVGDTNWKIPGVMDWRTGQYNPQAPITRESTTLFASDRDVYMFLVDDTHPIEIGVTRNGDPDLIFRGFIVWNSEVGNKTLGVATFYLRGVCQNRCLWGVEGFSEITLRHSKNAPGKFSGEVAPALDSYANANTNALLQGIEQARSMVVAKTDDDRKEWLLKRGFTQGETKSIIETVVEEEGKPAESIWDMVQGITAVARTRGNQDDRLALEKKAGRLLDKVA